MPAVKKGLGRGLDIMIPEKIVETSQIKSEDVSRETLLPISDIEPNKLQPRRSFSEDSLHELAESIKQYGVIQPLIVQKKDKYYEIVAGERRWRAARIAGLKKIPVIIKDFTPQEAIEIALIENIQREDLNPIEEAQAYQRLIQEFNLKQDELAERVSKSRVAVTNSIRLLKLDERVQQMLIDDMLTSGHARALLSIEDKEIQYNTACFIFDKKLSVRETEKLIKKMLDNKQKKQTAAVLEDDFIYRDIEERMKQIFGTKVSIHRKQKSKGRIEIEYYSESELERIIELFDSIK
jgi:ParB family chromosome partitioning protein